MLPGTPVGIVNWNDHVIMPSSRLFNNRIKNKIHALARKRKYASLEHLCTSQGLLYADIHKRDSEKLYSTLTSWKCDLVITSGCSFVPSAALPYLSHGAINMHPSWLPDYRGGEPVLWQIIDNKKELATSVHRLTDEYDRGAVLVQKRTIRPHAATKAALSNLTDGVLGREVLSRVIELLTASPDTKGAVQPTKSPTCYAKAESPESIANKIPIDSLSAQSLWDLIHYFGYCPQQWLGLSGWQKQVQWQPVRWHENNIMADKTQWRINISGLVLYLHSDQATIELKPRYSSLYRLLRK